MPPVAIHSLCLVLCRTEEPKLTYIFSLPLLCHTPPPLTPHPCAHCHTCLPCPDDYLPSDTSSHNSADNYESDASMENAVSSAAEDGQSEQTSDEEQQSASVSDESEEDAGGDGSGDGSSGLFVYPEPGCGKSYTKIKSWRSHKE